MSDTFDNLVLEISREELNLYAEARELKFGQSSYAVRPRDMSYELHSLLHERIRDFTGSLAKAAPPEKFQIKIVNNTNVSANLRNPVLCSDKLRYYNASENGKPVSGYGQLQTYGVRCTVSEDENECIVEYKRLDRKKIQKLGSFELKMSTTILDARVELKSNKDLSDPGARVKIKATCHVLMRANVNRGYTKKKMALEVDPMNRKFYTSKGEELEVANADEFFEKLSEMLVGA